MNVENDLDGEVDYLPVEGPWKKVTEKELWEALKRLKKGKSSGPSEVAYEMFLNDVCVRELRGVANGLLMGRLCQSHGRRAWLFPCIKVREMCWSVATTAQSSCWRMG